MLKAARVLKIRPSIENQSNPILKVGLPSLVILALGFGLFLFLSAPDYAIRLSPGRLDDYSTSNSLYPPEPGGDFAYTYPTVYFQLGELPRYLPLKVDFEISLDRPAIASPAQVEINEVDLPDYNLVRPLARLEQAKGQTGFQTYSVIVPARPESSNGLVLQIKANSFQLAGDQSLRGVMLRQVQVQAAERGIFQPETSLYALVVLGLLILVLAWCLLAGVGYVEIILLALMISLTCAEQVQQLHLYAGWLLVCLIGLFVCMGGWWWQRRNRRQGEFGWLLAGLVFTVGFFILGNGYRGDIRLYHIWISDALKYGPFDFYHNSPTFNYLPLIVYFFWLYGQLAGLVGLTGNEVALKTVVSLSLPAMAWLAWRFLTTQASPGQDKAALNRKLVPVFLLFGFNLATLYNPVVWGQTDALLALFLLGAVFLIYRHKYWLALVLLGLSLLLKLQAVMAGPLLLVLIWKKAGWKITVRGFGLSTFVALALALPVFGFRLSEISKYAFQGELGGQAVNYSRAYNFPFLTNYNFTPSNLVMVAGLGLIMLVYLVMARLIAVRELDPFTLNLMLALGVVTFFTFAIKMHERYLYYTLPFFLLASAYTYLDPKFSRQVRWLWLAFSLDGLLQLIFSRHTDIYSLLDPVTNQVKVINNVLENIYNWTGWLVEGRTFLETSLSLATIGLCGWAAYLLWQTLSAKAPAINKLTPESKD